MAGNLGRLSDTNGKDIPPTVCRRKADPRQIVGLWAAVEQIREHKQAPNVERITQYLQRYHNIELDAGAALLEQAVDEGVVIVYRSQSKKGNNAGSEQDGYSLPDMDVSFDAGKHDWYCFGCHCGGDVVDCSTCWRVYHPRCFNSVQCFHNNIFTCPFCLARKKPAMRMLQKDLSRFLDFVVIRLKEKSEALHRLHTLHGAEEDQMKLRYFVHHYLDLEMMEKKCADQQYKTFEEFHADTATVEHNVIICFGETSDVRELARTMVDDCNYELAQIRLCSDCFWNSHTRPTNWFALPCSRSHELVFAKQSGWSYWPAKVMNVLPDGYDVRFFGPGHQRAIVPAALVKPINTSPQSLGLKNATLSKRYSHAIDELAIHRRLLNKNENGGKPDEMIIEQWLAKVERNRTSSSGSSRKSDSDAKSTDSAADTARRESIRNAAVLMDPKGCSPMSTDTDSWSKGSVTSVGSEEDRNSATDNRHRNPSGGKSTDSDRWSKDDQSGRDLSDNFCSVAENKQHQKHGEGDGKNTDTGAMETGESSGTTSVPRKRGRKRKAEKLDAELQSVQQFSGSDGSGYHVKRRKKNTEMEGMNCDGQKTSELGHRGVEGVRQGLRNQLVDNKDVKQGDSSVGVSGDVTAEVTCCQRDWHPAIERRNVKSSEPAAEIVRTSPHLVEHEEHESSSCISVCDRRNVVDQDVVATQQTIVIAAELKCDGEMGTKDWRSPVIRRQRRGRPTTSAMYVESQQMHESEMMGSSVGKTEELDGQRNVECTESWKSDEGGSCNMEEQSNCTEMDAAETDITRRVTEPEVQIETVTDVRPWSAGDDIAAYAVKSLTDLNSQSSAEFDGKIQCGEHETDCTAKETVKEIEEQQKDPSCLQELSTIDQVECERCLKTCGLDTEERCTQSNVGDEASHRAEDCVNVGDEASHRAEDCVNVGDEASHRAEDCVNVGDEASHRAEDCVNVGVEASHRAEDCVNVGDEASHRAEDCVKSEEPTALLQSDKIETHSSISDRHEKLDRNSSTLSTPEKNTDHEASSYSALAAKRKRSLPKRFQEDLMEVSPPSSERKAKQCHVTDKSVAGFSRVRSPVVLISPLHCESISVAHKSVQADGPCTSCELKWEDKLRDYNETLKKDLQTTLAALEQRMREEYETDKQRAIKRISARAALELGFVRESIMSKYEQRRDEIAKQLNTEHAAQLSAVKKSLWCTNCGNEAMYYCCWATSYCSVACQKEHWLKEHRPKCRRISS